MAEYTAKECREKIEELNKQIAKLHAAPASTSAKGVFVSTQGKIKDLQAERKYWEEELRKALADEAGGDSSSNSAQGPDFKLQ